MLHVGICHFSLFLLHQMSQVRIPLTGELQFSDEELEMQRLLMWQQLAELVTPAIQAVVEFSKRVPSELFCIFF